MTFHGLFYKIIKQQYGWSNKRIFLFFHKLKTETKLGFNAKLDEIFSELHRKKEMQQICDNRVREFQNSSAKLIEDLKVKKQKVDEKNIALKEKLKILDTKHKKYNDYLRQKRYEIIQQLIDY
ncbi:MAG: hypothetical protein MHPSP_000272 [Paramarteilia canceri]